MGIFDKLKNTVKETINTAFSTAPTEETITFAALPESLAEMQALPEASLDTPFKAAALSLCALCAYAADKAIGTEMLNWLRGPGGPMVPSQISFLNDRLENGKKYYIPFSYFSGAKPENDYTPSEPFTLKMFTNTYSFQDEGYCTVHMTSGGADSPRQIKLRQKGNQWFMWEQFLLVGIREPKSQDPWA